MTPPGRGLCEQPDARLEAALAAAEEIPAPSPARERLIHALRHGGTRTEIVSAAEESIALTTALLRLANRPRTARGTVGSLPGALDVVDRRTAAAYIEGMDSFAVFGDSPPWHLLRMQMRHHGAAVRAAVDRISDHLQLPALEELRAAAMVHDIGKIALLLAFTKTAHRIYVETSLSGLLEHERAQMEIDHAALGGVLMRRWHLPESLARAIEGHHDPAASGGAAVIRLADLLVHFGHGRPVDLDDLVAAGDAIGLSRDALGELMYETASPFGARPRRVPEPCPLSERELDVLRLLAQGKLYKQIAAELGLSTSTVRSHLHRSYTRLGVADRTQAVLLASELGWL